jgi:transcriptional regulator with XRE-family HTH domain
VAERLNLLFEVIRPRALGRSWTSQEVADRCGVSADYVEALRVGTLAPDEVDPDVDANLLFAQRLDHLFRTRVSPATGKLMTQSEVAAALGGTSKQHVGNLRSGRNNPSIVLAQQVAEVFAVEISYFSAPPLAAVAACFGHSKDFLVGHDDDPSVVQALANLRLLRAMADKRLRHVVGRLVDEYEASRRDPS